MYKFFPPREELARAVLESPTVKFTSPTDFNDPFECAPRFIPASDQALDEYCAGLISRLKRLDFGPQLRIASKALKLRLRLNEKQLLYNAKAAVKDVGVACFSKNCKHVLMWSHYAQGHAGFCVEYCDPGPVSDHFGHTQVVEYSSTYPSIPFVDYCKLQDFAHYGVWEEDFARVSIAFSASAFLTKSPEWQYEEEVRCIRTPKRGGPGILPVPPDQIRGVVLGAKHSKEFASYLGPLVSRCLPHAYLAVAEAAENAFEVRVRTP